MPQGKQTKTSRKQQPGPELDKQTADLLQMYSAPSSTIGQFMPGMGGRMIGDLGLAGTQKPQIGMAFHPDMPRDARMNALLSAGATLGLDLTTDVGLKALMGLLQTKGVPVSPAMQSGVFALKGYGMNPIYEGIREQVFNNNLGEKAADVTKFADTHLNQGKMQAQYTELLPLLEMISQQPGAADDVTSLENVTRQKLINEKQNPTEFYGQPFKNLLPANMHPAVDKVTGQIVDVAKDVNDIARRSVTGGVRDVKNVGRGMKNIFQQQLQGFLSGKR
jgi:hypothetical protein